MFRIIHSVNQLSIYGEVANWCKQFGLPEEEKGQERQKESVTKSFLTSVKSQEVKLLVFLSKVGDFESLSQTIQFTRVCEDASFGHRVPAGMNHKTRPDEDDGFWQIIPLCREYTLSRVSPQSRAFAAIPGGTIIGPVIEVQVLKIAIPSPNDSTRTPYVMISRGKSQFVDEVHIPKTELRSSAELFNELQQQKEENLA